MNRSVTPTIKLVVGLGNPGLTYANTRHNAGAWFVEALCKQSHLQLKTETKFHARIAETNMQGQTVLLALSNTYMNHSGQAVGSLAKYFHIPPESILIAHDELDIPVGDLRFKIDGGHGGHNGLRDIVHHLSTRAFNRLRIGIGHPRHHAEHQHDVVDYVLQRPNRDEEKKIQTAIQLAIDVFPWMVAGDFSKVMNMLHTEHEKTSK